jgi:pyridoxamine 5'-phosphate oxidase
MFTFEHTKVHTAMPSVDLQSMRFEYMGRDLDEGAVPANPLELLAQWVQEAIDSKCPEPNAMTLATVNEEGQPSTRTVLLKEIRPEGLVFYTNYESRKAMEMDRNPRISLHFLWLELARQIRVEATAVRLDTQESKRYFQSRPKESQISAWASHQSKTIPSRVILQKRFRELEEKYREEAVLPLPPFWGGYLVTPSLFEFWQGRENRLHDRVQYRHLKDTWALERLQP